MSRLSDLIHDVTTALQVRVRAATWLQERFGRKRGKRIQIALDVAVGSIVVVMLAVAIVLTWSLGSAALAKVGWLPTKIPEVRQQPYRTAREAILKADLRMKVVDNAFDPANIDCYVVLEQMKHGKTFVGDEIPVTLGVRVPPRLRFRDGRAVVELLQSLGLTVEADVPLKTVRSGECVVSNEPKRSGRWIPLQSRVHLDFLWQLPTGTRPMYVHEAARSTHANLELQYVSLEPAQAKAPKAGIDATSTLMKVSVRITNTGDSTVTVPAAVWDETIAGDAPPGPDSWQGGYSPGHKRRLVPLLTGGEIWEGRKSYDIGPGDHKDAYFITWWPEIGTKAMSMKLGLGTENLSFAKVTIAFYQ